VQVSTAAAEAVLRIDTSPIEDCNLKNEKCPMNPMIQPWATAIWVSHH